MNLNDHGIYLTSHFLLAVHDDHYIRDTFLPFLFRCFLCESTSSGKDIVQNQESRYQSGERVYYEYIGNYDILGEIDVICLNGTWVKPPQCKGRVSYPSQ